MRVGVAVQSADPRTMRIWNRVFLTGILLNRRLSFGMKWMTNSVPPAERGDTIGKSSRLFRAGDVLIPITRQGNQSV